MRKVKTVALVSLIVAIVAIVAAVMSQLVARSRRRARYEKAMEGTVVACFNDKCSNETQGPIN